MSDDKKPDNQAKDAAEEPRDGAEATGPDKAPRDVEAAPGGHEPVAETAGSAGDADPHPAALPESELRDPEPEFHDEHEHEDPARGSLAAKALQALVILLIGAAVALWAGPKLAPHVPESVAAYLRGPEVATASDLAAVRADLEARLEERAAALEARIAEAEGAEPDPAAIAEAAAEAAGEAAAPLRAEIEALSDQIGEAEPAALAARIDQIETTLSGVTAQLRTLNDGMSDLDAVAGELPPEMAERLAGYSALVESVRAELSSVSERTASLSQRLDETETAFARREQAAREAAEAAAAEAERKVAAAETAARDAERRSALDAGFSELSRAMDAGEPYADAIATLAAASPDAPPPVALAEAAETGVPTLSALRSDLTDASRRALASLRQAEAGDGAIGRLFAGVRTAIEGVPVAEVEGDGPEAAIGRASARLADGDLDAAIAALEGLPPPAAEELQDWIDAASARRDAVAAAAAWRETLETGGA